MSAKVGQVTVDLQANTAQFERDMKRVTTSFDAALNPSKKLANEIKLLEQAGRSSAEIWAVYGNRIKTVAAATQAHGQAIDPTLSRLMNLNRATLASRLNFENLGQTITNFAQNPLQAAQAGFVSLLARIGPFGVGLGAVGIAAVAAGVAINKMANDAASAAEKIQNASYATGETVESIQALNLLSKQTGVGDLAGAIEKLNIQLADEAGGDFTEAILRMNIAIKDGAKAPYYLDELQKKYKALRQEIGNAATTQQMSKDLGRRLVDTLAPLLMQDEQISAMLDRINKSGAVMAKDQFDRMLALDSRIDENMLKWTAWGNRIKEIAAEVKLGLLEAFQPDFGPPLRTWRGKGASGGWDDPNAINEAVTGLTEIEKRMRAIAQADAIAGGEKGKMLVMTQRLNELQKQYTEEKGKEKSLNKFDAEKVLSLAGQIAAQKELIAQTSKLEGALRPLDAISRDIAAGLAAGFSQHQLISIYGDKILTAATEQRGFNEALTANQLVMESLAGLYKQINEGAGGLTEYTLKVVTATNAFITVNETLAENMRKMGIVFDETMKADYAKEKKDNELFPDWATPEAMKKFNDALGAMTGGAEEAFAAIWEAGQRTAWELEDTFYSYFENMADRLAANIVEWKGAWQTLIGTAKGVAQSILSAFMRGLFQPLTDAMARIGKSIGGWITDALTGAGAGWGGIFGSIGNAIAGGAMAGGSAAGATVGITGVPSLMGPMFATTGAAGGGAAAGTAAGTAAGLGASITALGSTLSASMAAFAHSALILLSNPITMIAGAAVGLVFAGKALANWAQGPNSWEAMSKEIGRDYGGLKLSDKVASAFASKFGITEPEAWGNRKEITSSPAMLAMLYGQAKEQGKAAAFMGSLSRLSTAGSGGMDFLTPFKQGLASGDFGELNKLWAGTAGALKGKVTGGLESMFLPKMAGANMQNGLSTEGGARGFATVSPGSQTVTVKTGDSQININIYGAGHDLVSRVRQEVIPIIKQHLAGGSSGLAEAVSMAVRKTARAY